MTTELETSRPAARERKTRKSRRLAGVALAAAMVTVGVSQSADAQQVQYQAQFAGNRLTVVRQIADINPNGDSFPFNFTRFGNELVFGADNGTDGDEPFTYDGSVTVSQLLDINSGAGSSLARVGMNSMQSRFMVFGSEILISADDGSSGVEVWTYDGTNTGQLLPEINPGAGSSNPGEGGFAVFGGQLVFSADDGASNHGVEPFGYNGTTAALLQDINLQTGAGSNPHQPTVFGNLLLFRADNGTNGYEPFAYDGTTVSMIRDINPNGSSYPVFGAELGGALFFMANDGAHGFELWKTDGTQAGTVLVKDINPRGDSTPFGFTVLGNELVFVANDGTHGLELWKTDGTAAGTVMIRDINRGGNATPVGLTVLNNTVVFAADDGVRGIELWRTDGTAAGTVMVTDVNGNEINRSGDALSPGFIPRGVVFNGHFVFVADDGVHGTELWRYNGQYASRITDINTSGDSIPTGLTAQGIAKLQVFGSELVFPADDGVDGVELWGMTEVRGDVVTRSPVVPRDLRDMLAAIYKSLYGLDVKTAISQLWDFIALVQKYLEAGLIDEAEAEELIRAAKDLIMRLKETGRW